MENRTARSMEQCPTSINLSDFTLSNDKANDLPITAVLQALSGRNANPNHFANPALKRSEVELQIRNHWAQLTRLVVEHNQLSEAMGDHGAFPDLQAFQLPAPNSRKKSMSRPIRGNA